MNEQDLMTYTVSAHAKVSLLVRVVIGSKALCISDCVVAQCVIVVLQPSVGNWMNLPKDVTYSFVPQTLIEF